MTEQDTDHQTSVAQLAYDWNAEQYERAVAIPDNRDRSGNAARNAVRYRQNMRDIIARNPGVRGRDARKR